MYDFCVSMICITDGWWSCIYSLNLCDSTGDGLIFTVVKYMWQETILHCRESTVGNMGVKNVSFKNKNLGCTGVNLVFYCEKVV